MFGLLREIASDRLGVDTNRLGWWIKRHAGRIVGVLKFERVDASRGAVRWRVVSVQGSQPSQGSAAPSAETVIQHADEEPW